MSGGSGHDVISYLSLPPPLLNLKTKEMKLDNLFLKSVFYTKFDPRHQIIVWKGGGGEGDRLVILVITLGH